MEIKHRYFVVDKNSLSLKETNSKLKKTEQDIYFALMTERYKYPIFDQEFGTDYEALNNSEITKNRFFLEEEAERIVREALKNIENIRNINNVEVNTSEKRIISFEIDIDFYSPEKNTILEIPLKYE